MDPIDPSRPAYTRRAFLATLAAAASLPLTRPAAGRPAAGVAAGPFPVCVFSKHLQWLGYEAMAELAAEIGFDGVDLTVRPEGHVEPAHVARDLPRAVEAVRAAGLATPLMTTAITDPADPLAAPVLEAAGALGVGAYRMGWVHYDDARGVAESLAAYRPAFAGLAELNARYGLHGAYQNHAGTSVGAPVLDIYWLLEGLDPRWIGCQYDIRHATVEGANAWPIGLRLLGLFVRTLIVKDFAWARRDGRWQVDNVPLGEGMVDFPAYFALVRELGIQGPISVHFEYAMEDEGLSGAERRRVVAAHMRRDLGRLRGYLHDAGL